MLRLRVLACWSLVLATLLGGLALAAEPAAKKRVVIVTGEDHRGHDWRTTAPALKALLAKDPRLEVSVVEDLKFLASPELPKYDVLVIHFKNYKKDVPGPEGWKGLQQFVDAGRGVVLVHFACGAFQERPDFVNIAGRVWNPKMRAHDGYGKFQVDIVDTEHPITRNMKAFETFDELYTCLDGTEPIKVLATAVSKEDKKAYPMAFVHQAGPTRVFQCVLGHDVKALSAEGVGELFRRGAAWSAKLE